MSLALVDRLRRYPRHARAILGSLTREERAALAFEWRRFWARPAQLPPAGRWKYWWLFGGRSAGKTYAAAQWVNGRARAGFGPIRLIAGTEDDMRQTMVEDQDSGILACSSPDFVPKWEPSKFMLTWPNGVVGLGFGAEKPGRLRGKQSRTDWYDDLTNWGAKGKATFDMAAWGLRLPCLGGARAVLTASPEETDLITALCDEPGRSIVVSHATSDDNFGNLDPDYADTIKQFAGSEQEQRERFGIMVRTSSSNPFRGLHFDEEPIRLFEPGELEEIALVLDPAEGCTAAHDEWGIGCAGRRTDGHVVGLEDASARLEEDAAGEIALDLLDRWADLHPHAQLVIVTETNRGEKRARSMINAAHWRRVAEGRSKRGLPEIAGVLAKDAKGIRAGELRGLYLSGLLHHLPGMAPCEAQQRGWNPSAPRRPAVDDRIDWWTHAVHYLRRLGGEGVAEPTSRFAGVGGVEGRYHDDDVRNDGDVGFGIGGVVGRNADPRWER